MRRFALVVTFHLLVTIAALASVFSTHPFAGRLSASPAGFQAPAASQSAEQRGAARLDGRRLLQDVQVLSAPEIEGRLTGTAGNRRAQAIILDGSSS